MPATFVNVGKVETEELDWFNSFTYDDSRSTSNTPATARGKRGRRRDRHCAGAAATMLSPGPAGAGGPLSKYANRPSLTTTLASGFDTGSPVSLKVLTPVAPW